MKNFILLLVSLELIVISIYGFSAMYSLSQTQSYIIPAEINWKAERKVVKEINAKIYAYNTIESQTDANPCIASSGINICGRNDVVANNCLPMGTKVMIEGKVYEVLDRMASRYGCSDFDISFGMDVEGAKRWGVKNIIIEKL